MPGCLHQVTRNRSLGHAAIHSECGFSQPLTNNNKHLQRFTDTKSRFLLKLIHPCTAGHRFPAVRMHNCCLLHSLASDPHLQFASQVIGVPAGMAMLLTKRPCTFSSATVRRTPVVPAVARTRFAQGSKRGKGRVSTVASSSAPCSG